MSIIKGFWQHRNGKIYAIKSTSFGKIVGGVGPLDPNDLRDLDEYDYKPFVTTSTIPADQLMTLIFPQRWNIEEFFNTEATLGWNRASTLNLNIRFGRLSMALIAQGAIYELRQKLPEKLKHWTAESLARKFFGGIDGDIRVKRNTIIVTLYNAPEAAFLKKHYGNMPKRLEEEGIDPRVPWLYDFKIDFRFK